MRWIAESLGRKRGLLYVTNFVVKIRQARFSVASRFLRDGHSRFLRELLSPLRRIASCSRRRAEYSHQHRLGLLDGVQVLLILLSRSPSLTFCRGLIGVTGGTAVQLGTVVGSFVALPEIFGSEWSWHWIYGIEAVLMLAVMAMFAFVHETPG